METSSEKITEALHCALAPLHSIREGQASAASVASCAVTVVEFIWSVGVSQKACQENFIAGLLMAVMETTWVLETVWEASDASAAGSDEVFQREYSRGVKDAHNIFHKMYLKVVEEYDEKFGKEWNCEARPSEY